MTPAAEPLIVGGAEFRATALMAGFNVGADRREQQARLEREPRRSRAHDEHGEQAGTHEDETAADHHPRRDALTDLRARPGDDEQQHGAGQVREAGLDGGRIP